MSYQICLNINLRQLICSTFLLAFLCCIEHVPKTYKINADHVVWSSSWSFKGSSPWRRIGYSAIKTSSRAHTERITNIIRFETLYAYKIHTERIITNFLFILLSVQNQWKTKTTFQPGSSSQLWTSQKISITKLSIKIVRIPLNFYQILLPCFTTLLSIRIKRKDKFDYNIMNLASVAKLSLCAINLPKNVFPCPHGLFTILYKKLETEIEPY